MNVVKAIIKAGEWLSDALKRLGFDNIPTNTVLDKTLTGLGATHGEINSKRNSIIIEPNVPVILGKLDENDNLEAVYRKCTPYTIKKYLQMDIPFKKIMTTPESFAKIRSAAFDLKIDLYKEYFCLFDECEKLTQDIDYRRTIAQPIYDFFKFENKALVSATPLEMSHPDFEKQEFQKIKIVPDYDFKKNLRLVVTNSYLRTLKTELQRLQKSKHICIFFNVTDGIAKIIESLNIKNYKVFCSEESVNKLQKRGLFNAYAELTYPLAKYNFFTCRFYSALDIHIGKDKPDILMLTDLRTAQWTIIDPFTEAIQIQGRFRKRQGDEITYNSLTHITTISPDLKVKSKEEIKSRVEQFIADFQILKDHHDNEIDKFKKKAILEDMKSLKFQDLIDDKGDVNPFSVDNLYNEERVRSYYLSANSLLHAYEDTGFFNVTYFDETECVGDDDIENLYTTTAEIDRRKQLVNLIDRVYTWYEIGKITLEDKKLHLDYFRRDIEGRYILNAYNKIGLTGIRTAEYKKSLIDRKVKEYDKALAERLRFSKGVLERIKNELPLNIYIPKKDIQQHLQMIYFEENVDYKAKQHTIKEYYDLKESGSQKEPSFKLLSFKF